MTRERSGIAARAWRIREATRWFVERESGRKLSADELREWDQWSADQDNKAEYDEICRLRAQFRSLPCPPLPSEEELKADFIEVAGGGENDSATGTTVVNFPRRAWSRSKLTRYSVSAGVGILATAGIIFMVEYGHWPFRSQSESWQVYLTASAEQRDVRLPDGSIATLGGHTVLRVRVTDESRTAFLDLGEALFRVERNPNHPFTVYAQNGSIHVLGTVFDVRNYSDRVQVTVTEGLVEVVPRGPEALDLPVADRWFSTGKAPASVRVEKGQRVSYGVDGSATDPQMTDAVLATDWTRGVITYTGKPLHEIIEDVQRYYSRPIVLDATVADFNYTGTFSQQNANGWLHTLPLIFPVEIVDQGDHVVIRRRGSMRQ